MSDEPKKGVITKETRVPIGLAVTAILAAITCTWYIAGRIGDIDTKLELSIRDRWTASDMERWAFQLERTNRAGAPPLNVPDVRSIRPNPSRDSHSD